MREDTRKPRGRVSPGTSWPRDPHWGLDHSGAPVLVCMVAVATPSSQGCEGLRQMPGAR